MSKKSTAKTVQGRECTKCGGTERYERNHACVACFREAKKATSKKAAQNVMPRPDVPKRGRNWPTFMTEAGNVIKADPIAAMLNRGFEP